MFSMLATFFLCFTEAQCAGDLRMEVCLSTPFVKLPTFAQKCSSFFASTYFLTLVLFIFSTCCILRCLVCIVVRCLVCIVVVVLCVLLELSCLYCWSCLVFIVVILCVFVVLCVYCFRCRTAG